MSAQLSQPLYKATTQGRVASKSLDGLTLMSMSISKNPLVSVIVPVYNAERYLRYCVESILQQSHRNIEVLLIDDGSTDSSSSICDEYASADRRVVVKHQQNGGIAKAQNAGLDLSKGDYIAFADNDDILDRRNLEILLHAIQSSGADMSKARWRQFGISQIDQVSREAAVGETAPDNMTVFTNPLLAYQTIFCKSFRLIGQLLHMKTETRYFNEANWCRLYKRTLWDGLRFPEGMYAQDTFVAGPLYSRMNKIVDINVNLYNWLQHQESVTHAKNDADFYQDHVLAAVKNFEFALSQGITPARSYYTLISNIKKASGSQSLSDTGRDAATPPEVQTSPSELLQELPYLRRLECRVLSCVRLIEKKLYDQRIKNME